MHGHRVRRGARTTQSLPLHTNQPDLNLILDCKYTLSCKRFASRLSIIVKFQHFYLFRKGELN
jgi:hypothetical protein